MKNILLFFFALVLFVSADAFAADQKPAVLAPSPDAKGAIQKNLTDPKSSAPMTKEDFADLPDKYIQEATAYYNECSTSGTMAPFYNCKCLASAYLDERIKLGPDANYTRIRHNVTTSGKCVDATGAAGYEYDDCLRRDTLMPYNIPIKEFCTCYASTYAKLFEKAGHEPDSLTMVRLQTEAYSICKNK